MGLSNIIRLDNFLTHRQYVKDSHISVNTTRYRIKYKLIATLKIDGQIFIDIEKSPLSSTYHSRSRKQTPPFTSLPDGIDKDRLVNVSSYARKKNKTVDKYYKAILSGKIFGLVIGGDVFCYKDEIALL